MYPMIALKFGVFTPSCMVKIIKFRFSNQFGRRKRFFPLSTLVERVGWRDGAFLRDFLRSSVTGVLFFIRRVAIFADDSAESAVVYDNGGHPTCNYE